MDCNGVPSKPQCGSEDWLFSNTTIQTYVTGTCQSGANFSSLYTPPACLCPTAAAISPCTCNNSNNLGMVAIYCGGKNLNDNQMANIISNIFTWSPIDTMYLAGNKLTKIPAGLSQYTQLIWLQLESNSITSIGPNDLSGLTAPVMYINLANNQISTIADNAFPSWSILHNLIQ